MNHPLIEWNKNPPLFFPLKPLAAGSFLHLPLSLPPNPTKDLSLYLAGEKRTKPSLTMAALSPSPDQAADLMKNLALEPQETALQVPEPAKKSSGPELGIHGNGHTQTGDRSVTPFLPDLSDPNLCYFGGYPYYGSYDPSGYWADYLRYADGLDTTAGVYGDNGSAMYHSGYGYPPYNPYSPASTPVPTSGNEGTDKKTLPGEAGKGNTAGLKARGNSTPYKPTYPNWPRNFTGAYGMGSLPGYYDPKVNHKGYGTLSKSKNDQSSKNNSYLRNSSYMDYQYPGPVSGYGYLNSMYPSKVYPPYAYGMGYGSYGYDSRSNSLGWYSTDQNKYKPRGRGNVYFGCNNGNIDGLDERNRGPRADGSKTLKDSAPTTVVRKGQPVPPINPLKDDMHEKSTTSDRDQYNLADFPEDYANAKFFVIKSYSEDDVHKSIKYNVWSSTSNGNKKLDAAYSEAQQISGCPVFFLFSVNTSGQFVGLAEMVGHVDFDKSVEYWQQDKWTGCFPVKWHIVKDIPNNLLKHIILENNENKPVTNSRDTQEVILEHGLKILKIFKNHTIKTCILDDFDFYEEREKIIQEKKKAKKQYFQKQVADDKASDEKAAAAIAPSKSSEVVSELKEDLVSTLQSNGILKPSENGLGSVASGDAKEDRSVPNGTVDGF